jgi:hypothetical protein
MKNTSFPRLWTKTSVKRILKDFKKGNDFSFLCNRSPEFKSIWEKHENELRKLVQDFVGDGYMPDFSVLFDERAYSKMKSTRFQIRLDFLKHEIARLSTK